MERKRTKKNDKSAKKKKKSKFVFWGGSGESTHETDHEGSQSSPLNHRYLRKGPMSLIYEHLCPYIGTQFLQQWAKKIKNCTANCTAVLLQQYTAQVCKLDLSITPLQICYILKTTLLSLSPLVLVFSCPCPLLSSFFVFSALLFFASFSLSTFSLLFTFFILFFLFFLCRFFLWI